LRVVGTGGINHAAGSCIAIHVFRGDTEPQFLLRVSW
jgi:hypothetical protein